MTPGAAVLDTSVLIANETMRPLDIDRIPDVTAVSVVTVGELHAGVLAATDTVVRGRRLATLEEVSRIEALPITAEAARARPPSAAKTMTVGARHCLRRSTVVVITALASPPMQIGSTATPRPAPRGSAAGAATTSVTVTGRLVCAPICWPTWLISCATTGERAEVVMISMLGPSTIAPYARCSRRSVSAASRVVSVLTSKASGAAEANC